MRIYKFDGTFVENKDDTEFGWYLTDLIPEESVFTTNCEEDSTTNTQQDKFLESVDVIEPEKPIVIKKINPNIKTQPIISVIDSKMEIEGVSVKVDEPKYVRELKSINLSIPSKDKLAKLISSCNTESKALLSVLYYAKYKSVRNSETASELFKTVNFRTTNFKHLISDKEDSVRKEMYKEIQNYHATKEDNMLSLMMELILTDMDCNFEDVVDANEPVNERDISHQIVIETSDLGNSIHSSCSSKEGNPDRSSRYLRVPSRSDVLSSIGLSDEDKSIQSFCEETFEMHSQVAEMKESFQEAEKRINDLMKLALALQNELKETLYLDDILHLLNGDVEKVRYRKLPFRVFHKTKDEECELNLII